MQSDLPLTDALGVDFGSSNTAAGALFADGPRLVPLEKGAETIPTAVFFEDDGGDMLIGAAADAAMLEGEEGRYMRALKLVLGAPLMRETRRIGRRQVTLIDVVAQFLSVVKARAEAGAGRRFTRVVSGRPVRFHADPARDAQAEADLREAYLAAGFAEVTFLPEPEAAAIGYGAAALDGAAGLGLIVDIGGGTSDFTLFRADPDAPRGLALLGSGGLRVGGADFDRQLGFDHVAPLLGKGSPIRVEIGSGAHPAPQGIYRDLASWEKIPFLYTAQTRREVEKMRRLAEAPEKLKRLERCLELELGHELAFAVEAAKIAANGGGEDGVRLGMLEAGLRAPLDGADLRGSTDPWAEKIAAAAAETLATAGVGPEAVGTVFLVGGSSLMHPVRDAMAALCPGAEQRSARAFTAVGEGLALAAGG
ncbi:Hsp70 family protein [Rhodovulum sp. DZ06]|uniref:Hsp70 family protein n=1 Tax=Rhodovulum sp. DZ06 TaxID=3425126 RepID=UPI003D349D5B